MEKQVPHRAYRPIRNDIALVYCSVRNDIDFCLQPWFSLVSSFFPSLDFALSGRNPFLRVNDFLERYFFLEQCLCRASDFLDSEAVRTIEPKE